MIAQYYGAKDRKKIKELLGTAYLISIIIGIVSVIVVCTTSDIWLKILNTPEEVFKVTKEYLIFNTIGYMFDLILVDIMEALRAIGNTKTPLIFATITSVLNIILDPIFIKIGYGVVGTAIATMISIFVGMVIEVIYIHKKSDFLKIDYKYLRFNKDYIKQIIKLGFPITFEDIFIAIVAIFSVNISNSAGIIGSAAYGIRR